MPFCSSPARPLRPLRSAPALVPPNSLPKRASLRTLIGTQAFAPRQPSQTYCPQQDCSKARCSPTVALRVGLLSGSLIYKLYTTVRSAASSAQCRTTSTPMPAPHELADYAVAPRGAGIFLSSRPSPDTGTAQIITLKHTVGARHHEPMLRFLPTLIKRPSAFLPMAMSIAALLLLGIVATSYRLVREPDEGAVAHIWQRLMAGQLPILAYFLIRWLPRLPRPTVDVFALQIAATMAPVHFLMPPQGRSDS